YEGANGVQAIDLIGRKLKMDDGAALDELIEEMEDTLEDCAASSNPELVTIADRFRVALRALEDASDHLLEEGLSAGEGLASATPYLTLAAEVTGGWLLAVGAVAGQRRLKNSEGDPDFARGKIALARFYAESVLPLAPARAGEVMRAGAPLLAAPDAALEG